MSARLIAPKATPASQPQASIAIRPRPAPAMDRAPPQPAGSKAAPATPPPGGFDFSLMPLRAAPAPDPAPVIRRSCDEGCADCCQDEEAPVRRMPEAPTPAGPAPLRIGPADDPTEHEAEAAADAVLRGQPARISASQPMPRASGAAGPTGVPADVAAYVRAPGAGQPLPEPVRARFAGSFGQPLHQVRLHTDSRAGEVAKRLGAKAFAHGPHIVFAPGRFAPESRAGQHLLAHEIAHVLQQPGHIARQPTTKATATKAAAGEACPTPTQVGAGVARPEDHSKGPSGTYYIYGPVFSAAQADANAYTAATLRAWARWRFGSLSVPMAERIVGDAMRMGAWQWEGGHTPREGCQGGTRLSMDQMNQLVGLANRDPAARQAEKRETAAGMPTLPAPALAPEGDVVEVVVTGTPRSNATPPGAPPPRGPPQGGKEPGGKEAAPPPGGVKAPQPKDPQTPAERALDPTSIYEAGQAGSNAPPFPAHIDGPELEVTRGIGTYTMALDYAAVAGGETFLQMAYAMNLVDYHWEIFDVTQVVRSGLGGGVQEEMRSNAPDARAAAAAGGATRQRAVQAAEQLSEETVRSFQERRDPVRAAQGRGAVDVVTRAWANELNLDLLGASAIIAAGGQALHALADLMGGYAQQREIAFPDRPGFYLLRCVAQPHPRGRQHTEIRAASVKTKIVEVRPPDFVAQNMLGTADAQLKMLELRKKLTTDPDELKALDAEATKLKEQTSGDLVGYLKRLVQEKRDEVKAAPSWRRGPLGRELETLERRLAAAEKGREGTSGPAVRPMVAFTSVVTGATYPLLLELSPLAAEKGAAVRLIDLTVPDPQPKDFTGATLEQAVRNAFDDIAFHGNLGRGRLAVRMPPEWTGQPQTLMLTTGNAGTELVRQRLQDLATALMVLGLFVPGVGEVSALIGAALAVERLATRIIRGTLRFDVEAISDTLAIVGAIAQGAQLIGRLRVVKAGDTFIAAMRGGDEVALKAAADGVTAAVRAGKIANGINLMVGAGGLIWGDFMKLRALVDLQEKELAGEVTHAEAARQRADLLIHAITDHAILFAGALRPAAKPKGGEPAEAAATRGEIIPEDQLASRANQPAPAPGGKQAPTAVRARFRTPDGLHEIFVLADGRIFRCSASCAQMRGWYHDILHSQQEPGRQQQARELNDALAALEGRTTAGENSPELNEAIGRLDQRMRDFVAPDVAAGLDRQFVERGLAKPGEPVLTLDQARNLLRGLNLDDIQALAKAGGFTSVAGIRRLGSGSPRMLAAFKALLDAFPGDASALSALAQTLEGRAVNDAHLTAAYQRAAWLRQAHPGLAGSEAIRLCVDVARGVSGAEQALGEAVAAVTAKPGQPAAKQAVGTRENPLARGDNCGFAAIAYALNVGRAGEAVSAETLFAQAKQRENLPNAKPTLIVEGPSADMNYEAQSKFMQDVTGSTTGDWSFEGNAAKAGLKVDRLLPAEVVRAFEWSRQQPAGPSRAAEVLEASYERDLALFQKHFRAAREKLPPDLRTLEPKADRGLSPQEQSRQAELREAVAAASAPSGENATRRAAVSALPGDYMIMWKGNNIDHFINLHIDENLRVTGYDPQNGQVYDGWDTISARGIRYLWRVKR